MQQLSEALRQMIDEVGSKPEHLGDEFPGMPAAARLQEMAGEWAKMSAMTFQGALLEKGLAVSRAIAEFTAELIAPSPSS